MITAELPTLSLPSGCPEIDEAFLQEAAARAELEDEIEAFRRDMTLEEYRRHLKDLQLDAEL
jgi:hypothetical protein